MTDPVQTALALFAVVLFALALLAMTNGSFGVAGVGFLGASIVLYFRETKS